MNVLIASAGRRNYLIEYFKAALGDDGLVIAADASPRAPALYQADRAFLVPAAADPGYLEAMVRICRRNEVSLVLSVNDLELPFLAANRDAFAAVGTLALVSDPDTIHMCHDKLLTAAFLGGIGVGSPRTADPDDVPTLVASGELRFPLMVKPRFGSASAGLEVVEDRAELEAALTLAAARDRRERHSVSARHGVSSVVVQEYVSGEEYGLDVINDLHGNHVAVAVKRKLAMRAGETDRALTVEDGHLRSIGAAIGTATRHVGNLDCDVLVSEDRTVVIDLNPRFGGGYPFSHAAGVNLPAAILCWLRDGTPDPAWFVCRPGVAFAKYDQVTAVDGPIETA